MVDTKKIIRRVRGVKRIPFNRLNIKFAKKEKYMKNILECQKEIANMSDDYVSEYKGHELFFWKNIPKWMKEDNEKLNFKTCLDIGSAFGTLALYSKKFLGCQVTCVDIRELKMDKKTKKNFDFIHMNIELGNLPNKKYDMIILTEVLEHFNFHPLPTLKKIHAVLNDNGRLYLSTPDASQWSKVTKYYNSLNEMPYPNKNKKIVLDHIWQFSKEELLKVLDEAEFKVERFAYSPGLMHRHFNLTLVKKNKIM